MKSLPAIMIAFLLFSFSSPAQTVIEHITTNTTWTAEGSPYILEGGSVNSIAVLIENDTQPVTLTIEQGVTVIGSTFGNIDNWEPMFIQVGNNGRLVVEGVPGNPVLFTSDEDEKERDQWGGIVITDEADADNCDIRYAVFEAGGFEFDATLLIEAGSPGIYGCTFRHNHDALQARPGATPTVWGCTFENNAGTAVEFEAGGGVIANNTFKNNGDAVYLQENFPDDISGNLMYEDQRIFLPLEVNRNASIGIPGGQAAGGNAPFFLRRPERINQIAMHIENFTLTIEEGVEIRGSHRYLDGNDEPCHIVVENGGGLKAEGGEYSWIKFTSYDEEKKRSQWGGIYIDSTANTANVSFEYTTFESTGFEYAGALVIDGGSPRVTNCEFRLNDNGIYVERYAAPVITGSRFIENRRFGIEIVDHGGTITDNFFEDNGDAILINNNFPSVMKDNIIEPDQRIILPRYITRDLTITNPPGTFSSLRPAPFWMDFPPTFDAAAVEVTDAVLTINAGIEIRGSHRDYEGNDEPGFMLIGEGAGIKVLGEEGNPVLFRAYDELNGDDIWGAIEISDDAAGPVEFTYAEFEQAGFEYDAAVQVGAVDATFTNCTFRNNDGGIHFSGEGFGEVTDCLFTGNSGNGLIADENALISVYSSIFTMNRWGGYIDDASALFDACEFRSNESDGLTISGSLALEIMNSVFDDNGDGLYFNDDPANVDVTGSSFTNNRDDGIDADIGSESLIYIANSSITGNEDDGIANRSEYVVDAPNNWWGHPSGPYDPSDDSNDPTGLYNPNGLGDAVDDYVNYADWLEFKETENPAITGVVDVPNDQGRWVYLIWAASTHDAPGDATPIVKYSLWRQVDEEIGRGTRSTAPLLEGKTSFVEGQIYSTQEDDRWAFISDITAVPEFSKYYFTAPTPGDSTAESIVWSTFMVIAHTADPAVYFKSAAATGYSIDNIAPGMPAGLMAALGNGAVTLNWLQNDDKDLMAYNLYRSANAAFTPSQETFVASVSDTMFTDTGAQQDEDVYYRISAVDINWNEGDYSEAVKAVTTGVAGEPGGLPQQYELMQNYPNPFNPTTTISFALPLESNIVLRVYNVLGQQSITLLDEVLPAGYHETHWNAASMPSGLYFYRIDASALDGTKAFTLVRKMLLVK